MKPDSIKTIIRTYVNEKQHSSSYNVRPVRTRRRCRSKDFGIFVNQAAGSPGIDFNGLTFLQYQSPSLPLDEHNVPPEPQLNERAVRAGRRLIEISREFDLNRINGANNQASSNGNRCIQFRESIIRVPATCDHVQIPIIRTRPADREVNVSWRTSDKSAKTGHHYVNSQGNISFGQVDEEKTIKVEIIQDQERGTGVHFSVELFDADGIFNTLTVFIVDDSRLNSEERHFITNIFSRALDITMSEIVTCLSGKLTTNTFKAALQLVSSCADSIPKELAFGAELFRLTMPPTSFLDVCCEYFSYLPELEDIADLS